MGDFFNILLIFSKFGLSQAIYAEHMANETSAKFDQDIENCWLIPTKISAPGSLPNALVRPGILHLLTESTQTKLYMVQAAMGYGKTVLLNEWYQQLPTKSTIKSWLRLSDGEQEPRQFLAYLIMSLSYAGLTGTHMGPLLSAARQGLASISTMSALVSLINQVIQSEKDVVIFLDDYHRAESREVIEILNILLESIPMNLRLVVSSRNSPQFKIEPLNLQGRLLRIDSQSLRFSNEDAGRFLKDEPITEGLREIIINRAEGWVAGLQLAKNWIRRHQSPEAEKCLDIEAGFSGRIDELAHYFSEQVLADLPEHLLEFLAKTSVVEQFTAEFANALCGRNDSHELLSNLSQLDPLIESPRNDEISYRYHPLFSEFLAGRLSSRATQSVADLNLIASYWYQEQGCFAKAVRYSKRARNFTRAAELIVEMGCWRMVLQGDGRRLGDLIGDIPEEVIEQFPSLQLCRVYLLTKQGNFDDAEILLTALSKQGSQRKDDSADQKAIARNSVVMRLVLSSYRESQNIHDDLEYIVQFVKTLPLDDHASRGTLFDVAASNNLELGNLHDAQKYCTKCIDEYRRANFPGAAVYGLFVSGEITLLQGNVLKAREIYEQALYIASEKNGLNCDLATNARIFLAEIEYIRNDVDEGDSQLSTYLENASDNDGWLSVYLSGFKTLASQEHNTNGIDSALAVLHDGTQVAIARGLPRLEFLLSCEKVQHLLMAGHFNSAKLICKEENVNVQSLMRKNTPRLWREQYAIGMCLAIVAIGDQNVAQALEILHKIEKDAITSQRRYHLIEILVSRAICLWLMRKQTESCASLEEALELARPQGIRSSFFNLGRPIEAMLHFAQKRVFLNPTKVFINELLLDRENRRARYDPFENVLTRREVEILDEMSSGCSNKVIARNLAISPSTVNFHLKNIYKKLNANDRKMAVFRAKEQGLILPRKVISAQQNM